MHTDHDFYKKLSKYKTAYSPLYKEFVGIIGVYGGENNTYIKGQLPNMPEGKYIIFRPNELINYCL